MRDNLTEKEYISIHALFAEGDLDNLDKRYTHTISIHALFAEGDMQTSQFLCTEIPFLSTPSSQRATER